MLSFTECTAPGYKDGSWGRSMVYKFDPVWFNGTTFELDRDWEMGDGWMECVQENRPIPAYLFPKSLTINRAKAPLPDLFHASRGLIIVSERARAVFDTMAPGQVEFIPVEIKKASTGVLNPAYDVYYSMQAFGRSVKATFAPGSVPFFPVGLEPKQRITFRLNLASAYYFINVLGRAQRLLWLQMPTDPFSRQKDGVERFGLLQNYSKWKFCDRSQSDPLIWREAWWRDGNKEYRGHNEVMIDDILWRELDARFPGQINALRAGAE
jgi:hypothetical protein